MLVRPADPAERVPEHEPAPVHPVHAGQPGGGDAQAGHPAAEEHGLRPVPGEERLAGLERRQALGVERARASRTAAGRPRARCAKPTLSPRMAAAAASAMSTPMSIRPSCASSPAAISAVSPGTGIPIVSIAISAKTSQYPTSGGMSTIAASTRRA